MSSLTNQQNSSRLVETRGPVDARMTIDPSETDSFNGKPVVKMHDQPIFREIAVLPMPE